MFNEEVYQEVFRTVAIKLNQNFSPSSTTGQLDDQLKTIYNTMIKSVLELGYWLFSVRKSPLVKYTDADGGFRMPPDYVKFLYLANWGTECEICTSRSGVRNFDLLMIDGRLHPGTIFCPDYSMHDQIYYISSDFPLSLVKGSFIEAVSLKIVIHIGKSKGLGTEDVRLLIGEYETLVRSVQQTGLKEFTPAVTNHFDFATRPNSYGKSGKCNTRYL